jgi:hypothetical protein
MYRNNNNNKLWSVEQQQNSYYNVLNNLNVWKYSRQQTHECVPLLRQIRTAHLVD